MGKKRSFHEISIGNEKNSMQEMKKSYKHVQDNAMIIIDSVLQKSKEEETTINSKLRKLNQFMIQFKENKQAIVDAFENIEKSKENPEEMQEAIEQYNSILERYDKQFSDIRNKGNQQLMMDLSKLFPMQTNQEEKVSTYKEVLQEYKEYRDELKNQKEEKRKEREMILNSFAKEIQAGEFDQDEVVRFLQQTFQKFSDDVKKEFEFYGLHKDVSALMALKQLTDIFGYNPEKITPAFFNEEKDNVIKEVKKEIAKADKIKQKLFALVDQNKTESEKLLQGLHQNSVLGTKFIMQEERVKQKNNKYEFIKQLQAYIQREKNFKDHLQNTIYT